MFSVTLKKGPFWMVFGSGWHECGWRRERVPRKAGQLLEVDTSAGDTGSGYLGKLVTRVRVTPGAGHNEIKYGK